MTHTRGMPDLAAGAPYTWDDFIELDDDDRRELIDGELVEIEGPNRPHERIVALLRCFLVNGARAGNGGDVLDSGYKIRISAKRGVMPDVQFFRRGNSATSGQGKGLVDGQPDLVVEIISPSSRRYDRVTKLNWYASRGVPEYWIVDPDARSIEQLVLTGGAYTIVASVGDDAVFEPRTFAGIAELWAELWAARRRSEIPSCLPAPTWTSSATRSFDHGLFAWRVSSPRIGASNLALEEPAPPVVAYLRALLPDRTRRNSDASDR